MQVAKGQNQDGPYLRYKMTVGQALGFQDNLPPLKENQGRWFEYLD